MRERSESPAGATRSARGGRWTCRGTGPPEGDRFPCGVSTQRPPGEATLRVEGRHWVEVRRAVQAGVPAWKVEGLVIVGVTDPLAQRKWPAGGGGCRALGSARRDRAEGVWVGRGEPRVAGAWTDQTPKRTRRGLTPPGTCRGPLALLSPVRTLSGGITLLRQAARAWRGPATPRLKARPPHLHHFALAAV